MTIDWRRLADAGKYDEIDWLDLPWLDQAAYLLHLKAKVPMADGKFLVPNQIPGDGKAAQSLREAAKLLALGELESSVAVPDDIPSYADRWAATARAIRDAMLPYAEHRETTGPNEPPASHVEQVLGALDQLRLVQRYYMSQDADSEVGPVIEEAIAEAAMMGFTAGQHAQIVMHTPFYQAQAGSLTPVLIARDSAEQSRLKADAIAADRDAAVAERHAVVQDNAELTQEVIGVRYGRRKGGAVMQDKAELWRPLALALLPNVVAQHRPRTLKDAANRVQSDLRKLGMRISPGTVENLLRPHFQKPSENPRS